MTEEKTTVVSCVSLATVKLRGEEVRQEVGGELKKERRKGGKEQIRGSKRKTWSHVAAFAGEESHGEEGRCDEVQEEVREL